MTNEQAARQLIATATRGAHLGEEGERNTPARMVKGLLQLLDGYETNVDDLATLFPATSDDVVVVKDIPYSSMCEHHVLPFRGNVSIAYIPDEHIIGLSKMPRIVRAISRRLQVQERMTSEIAEAVDRLLKPVAVMVVATGVHSCAELRGIETRAEMVTSHCRGLFRTDSAVRAEVMGLLRA